jgi:hypothetical protein
MILLIKNLAPKNLADAIKMEKPSCPVMCQKSSESTPEHSEASLQLPQPSSLK